ncbi:hypothetical protein D3C80_1633890 [compost metagenome]
MLAQHPLAPTVDGRDRGFVHPLRRNIEAVGAAGPVPWGKLIAQLLDQPVGGADFRAEEAGCFGQPRADAITKLLGGGIGKGHYQYLWRQ